MMKYWRCTYGQNKKLNNIYIPNLEVQKILLNPSELTMDLLDLFNYKSFCKKYKLNNSILFMLHFQKFELFLLKYLVFLLFCMSSHYGSHYGFLEIN